MARVLIVLAVMGAWLAASVAAAPPTAIPADSVAWWQFDPGHFKSGAGPDDGGDGALAGAVESMLRIAVASRVIEDRSSAAVVQGLLAASVVGDVPHVLCAIPLGGNDSPVGEVGAVLSLRTLGDHRAYVRTIEAILVGGRGSGLPDEQAAAAQRTIDLPGNRRGVAFALPGWPAWREVSWCSTEGEFVVGLGRGALDRWFAAAPVADGAWREHQQTVDRARPPGDVFMECYADLNALRRLYPDQFAAEPLAGVLHAMRLSNARDFMLHARWIEPANVLVGDPADPSRAAAGSYAGPPMIAIDASWSARSEKPGEVEREAISTSSWPENEMPMPPPPGRYVVVLPSRVLNRLDEALTLYRSTLRAESRAQFEAAERAWRGTHRAALARVSRAAGPWIVLSDYPRPSVAMIGATTLYLPLRAGERADAFARDLGELLQPFKNRLEYRDKSGVWSLRVDPSGLVRVITWGMAESRRGAVLVGGVDIGVAAAPANLVETNRAWLRGDAGAP
ncbi:MAG: hypothetical protein KF745_07260 [Phycisphaeraceae bacterium]|nr:hypothetical protein [Phycisphaeraceae bacterium]